MHMYFQQCTFVSTIILNGDRVKTFAMKRQLCESGSLHVHHSIF